MSLSSNVVKNLLWVFIQRKAELVRLLRSPRRSLISLSDSRLHISASSASSTLFSTRLLRSFIVNTFLPSARLDPTEQRLSSLYYTITVVVELSKKGSLKISAIKPFSDASQFHLSSPWFVLVPQPATSACPAGLPAKTFSVVKNLLLRRPCALRLTHRQTTSAAEKARGLGLYRCSH